MPHLPVAGGAAASGIAAAKTAESAIARTGPAESAAAIARIGPAKSAAADDEPAITAPRDGAQQPEKDGDTTQDHRPGDGIGSGGLVAPRRGSGVNRHLLGLGDGVADGLGRRQHAIAIIALA